MAEQRIRIVVDEAAKPKLEKILLETGINTPSQLFKIFLFNFGDRLVKKLKED